MEVWSAQWKKERLDLRVCSQSSKDALWNPKLVSSMIKRPLPLVGQQGGPPLQTLAPERSYRNKKIGYQSNQKEKIPRQVYAEIPSGVCLAVLIISSSIGGVLRIWKMSQTSGWMEIDFPKVRRLALRLDTTKLKMHWWLIWRRLAEEKVKER